MLALIIGTICCIIGLAPLPGSLRKAVLEGDVDNGSLMAGQSVSMVKKIQPVRAILNEIVNQAEKQIISDERL